ncbi:MAG: hypothetical protein JSV56_11670 [Methanomassiliicoccales archaeon]|nr:MAG: hypothetical protein JSV56_11670 [Methanomassiliicoccales archaeon]
MAEDKEQVVRPVVKNNEEIETKVDEKIIGKPEASPSESQPSQTPRKGFQVPKIPTDKIFKTLTDKEMMKQTLHDETMEPHVHMAILILIVFILAIIISLLGI